MSAVEARERAFSKLNAALANPEEGDVTVVCRIGDSNEHACFRAHKAKLVAHSPRLDNVFRMQCDSLFINETNLPYALRSLLQFCYLYDYEEAGADAQEEMTGHIQTWYLGHRLLLYDLCDEAEVKFKVTFQLCEEMWGSMFDAQSLLTIVKAAYKGARTVFGQEVRQDDCGLVDLLLDLIPAAMLKSLSSLEGSAQVSLIWLYEDVMFEKEVLHCKRQGGNPLMVAKKRKSDWYADLERLHAGLVAGTTTKAEIEKADQASQARFDRNLEIISYMTGRWEQDIVQEWVANWGMITRHLPLGEADQRFARRLMRHGINPFGER